MLYENIVITIKWEKQALTKPQYYILSPNTKTMNRNIVVNVV